MTFTRGLFAACFLRLASVNAERMVNHEDNPLMQSMHIPTVQPGEHTARSDKGLDASWGLAEAAEVFEEAAGDKVDAVKEEVEQEIEQVAQAAEAVVEKVRTVQLQVMTGALAEMAEAEELAAEKLRVAKADGARKIADAEGDLRQARAERLRAEAAKGAIHEIPKAVAPAFEEFAKAKGAEAVDAIDKKVAEVAKAVEAEHVAEETVKDEVQAAAEERLQEKVKDVVHAEEMNHEDNPLMQSMHIPAVQLGERWGRSHRGLEASWASAEAVGEAEGRSGVSVTIKEAKEGALANGLGEAALASEVGRRVQESAEHLVDVAEADVVGKVEARAAAKATVLEQGTITISQEEFELLTKIAEESEAQMGPEMDGDFKTLRKRGIAGLQQISPQSQQFLMAFLELVRKEQGQLTPVLREELEEIRTAPKEKFHDRLAKTSVELNGTLIRLGELMGMHTDAPDAALAEEEVRVLTGLLSMKVARYATGWSAKWMIGGLVTKEAR